MENNDLLERLEQIKSYLLELDVKLNQIGNCKHKWTLLFDKGIKVCEWCSETHLLVSFGEKQNAH